MKISILDRLLQQMNRLPTYPQPFVIDKYYRLLKPAHRYLCDWTGDFAIMPGYRLRSIALQQGKKALAGFGNLVRCYRLSIKLSRLQRPEGLYTLSKSGIMPTTLGDLRVYARDLRAEAEVHQVL